MRYSYEFKRMCVEMYREGRYPDTPDGIKTDNFHRMIYRWYRIEESCGPDALKHKSSSNIWTPEAKLELVQQVLSGKPNQAVAFSVGISDGLLYGWVRKYKAEGYNGLVEKPRGRKPKEPAMKRKKLNINNPRKIEESELEELIRLRAENEYMRTEIAVIKKEIALREEKEAARLKAKKQQSSKSSAKKDTN